MTRQIGEVMVLEALVNELPRMPKDKRQRMVTYEGRTLPLAELCREHHIEPHVVYRRLRRGWGLHKAINTPVNPHSSNYDKWMSANNLPQVADSPGLRIIRLVRKRLVVGEFYMLPRPWAKGEDAVEARYKCVKLCPHFAEFESAAGFHICFRYFDLAYMLKGGAAT